MSKRLFYGYFFLIVLVCISYFLYGISGVIKFLGAFFIYTLIFYVLYWIIKTIFGRIPLGIVGFFSLYTYKMSIALTIMCILIGSFSYYQNNINPAKMPLYTISNGEKTILFQAMSHIAQESFYEGVQKNIAYAKNDDYILFFEGVRRGTKENEKIFEQALGVKITPELYEAFSHIYGVTHQNNDDFLGIRNKLDYNVDLDIDTLVSIYLEKLSPSEREKYNPDDETVESLLQKKTPVKESSDITADLLKQIDSLGERELQTIRYINKSILNFMIKHESLRNMIISRLNIQDIFSVILDDRNAYITQQIIISDQDKIFAIYGLMHFEGILKLLQEHDDNWKIVNTTYSYPISSPNTPLDIFGW